MPPELYYEVDVPANEYGGWNVERFGSLAEALARAHEVQMDHVRRVETIDVSDNAEQSIIVVCETWPGIGNPLRPRRPAS